MKRPLLLLPASLNIGVLAWFEGRHAKVPPTVFAVNEKNVLDEHPEIVGKLQQKITGILRQGRTTPGARQSNDTGHWKDLSWIEPTDCESPNQN